MHARLLHPPRFIFRRRNERLVEQRCYRWFFLIIIEEIIKHRTRIQHRTACHTHCQQGEHASRTAHLRQPATDDINQSRQHPHRKTKRVTHRLQQGYMIPQWPRQRRHHQHHAHHYHQPETHVRLRNGTLWRRQRDIQSNDRNTHQKDSRPGTCRHGRLTVRILPAEIRLSGNEGRIRQRRNQIQPRHAQPKRTGDYGWQEITACKYNRHRDKQHQ